MLCNEGDVIHTFLLEVYGDTAFHLSTITSAQLNTAFETSVKLHSKRNVPKIKFVTVKGIPPDKAHMYNPLDFGKVFQVEYEIEYPGNLLINEESMEKYNKAFCFILTIKFFLG